MTAPSQEKRDWRGNDQMPAMEGKNGGGDAKMEKAEKRGSKTGGQGGETGGPNSTAVNLVSHNVEKRKKVRKCNIVSPKKKKN